METGSTSTQQRVAETRLFSTTHWSVVLAASQADSPQAQEALARLCQTYWYPLYAFVRRQGHSGPDAKDLTQEFFVRLLRSHFFAVADPKRGRFRSFLLASLKHFIAHEWEKGRALKRGGGIVFMPLDAADCESRYALEEFGQLTADKLFERRWALALLDEVLTRLRREYEADGRQRLFEELKPALTGEKPRTSYAEVADALGMTEGAIKVAVHRLRHRYGEFLREEIAHTVASPAEVEDELRHLLRSLSE